MDATTLLRKQHAEVKALFKQFDKTQNPQRQRELFNEIADSLAAHCTIEEKIFYPGVFAEKTEDMLKEAVEEHLAAKRLIADVLDMDPSDSQYVAKVTVLSEVIDHHVEEEHDDLFPKVRKLVDAARLKAMGVEMKKMFDELMAKSPRKQVPAETAEAAPLPKIEKAAA